MPIYHSLGSIPPKRHTVFEKPNGIYYEQLFGTEGFHGMSSLLYHTHRPTMIRAISEPLNVAPIAAVQHNISPMMLKGWDIPSAADFLDSRVCVLFNHDLNITLSAPSGQRMDYFYKNADADEMIFIQIGRAHV